MSATALVKDLVGERPFPRFDGRCVFCGARCYGRTCKPHAVLVALDPHLTIRDPDTAWLRRRLDV